MVVIAKDAPRRAQGNGVGARAPYNEDASPSPADAFVTGEQLGLAREMLAGYPAPRLSVVSRILCDGVTGFPSVDTLLFALAPVHDLDSIRDLNEGEHALAFVWITMSGEVKRIEDFLSPDTAGLFPVVFDVRKSDAELVVEEVDDEAVPTSLRVFFADLRGSAIPLPDTGAARNDDPPYHSLEMRTAHAGRMSGVIETSHDAMSRPALIVPSPTGVVSGMIYCGGLVRPLK